MNIRDVVVGKKYRIKSLKAIKEICKEDSYGDLSGPEGCCFAKGMYKLCDRLFTVAVVSKHLGRNVIKLEGQSTWSFRAWMLEEEISITADDLPF